MDTIFQGIKVLDLTRVIAGPLCTQLMADSGATVYKIERPGEGDDSRRMGPFLSDAGKAGSSDESTVFLAYNRGKHSVTVDLAQPEGAALVRALALSCDVVVENFKTGALRKYQLDYESLRQDRPDIIYCSITGFGQTGPYASLPAYDFILQGMAGPMSTCGQPDGTPGAEPMRTSIAITDVVTGLYANIAVVSALYHKQQTGQGQHIDTALLDAAVALNGHLAVAYLATGNSPERAGNRNPIAAPSEVFASTDGHLIVAAGNNGQFTALCQVLGQPLLAQDERFATNAMRVNNRAALQKLLADVVIHHQRDDLLSKLRAAGVPCGPINNMEQVFADPQVQHRELAISLPHSSGIDVDLVRNPMRFGQTPVVHKAPPVLGEHTEQVLAAELGLDSRRMAELRAAKII
ncbi:CoA transferase [Alcaligenaceae bacterium]|nr:CoA transferase [Alcaligenaceae bacterium]